MNTQCSCTFRSTCLALLAALSVPAAAALPGGDDLSDLSLEDLMKVEVISASKFSQQLSEAPSAVQVISAEDIRRHGWRTLAEALDSLPGLYASTDRAFGFVGARGFMVPGDYNMRFLLLLDGQPLNDNLYDQANLGHEFRVDMALIDRIEYVPGPGSSIYGANAMFGVINVMTRSARTLPSFSIRSVWQADGWRELGVLGSYRGGQTGDLVYSFSRASKSGRDLRYPDAAGLPTADGSASADGMTHGLDSITVTRGFVGWRRGELSLSAWAARRDVHPSSALYGVNFDDGRLHLIDSSYGAVATWQHALQSDLNLSARLAYQKITYQGDAPYFDATVGSYVNRDQAVGTWLSGEARVLYSGWPQHKLIAGLDFQHELEAMQKNADIGVAVNAPLAIDTRRRKQGIYLQDEWNFAAGWRLNAGLRHDMYSQGGTDSSPRLALIWNASPDTTFKLLAGRAYRVANAYEAYYARDLYYLANPDLKPETIRTVELVAEHKFDAGQEAGLSLFDYKLERLIRQVDTGGGVFQYQNQDSVKAHGLELFHRWRNRGGASLTSSLALNHVRDLYGRELGNSPAWIAKVRASSPCWNRRLVAALDASLVGPRTLDWRGQRSRIGSQPQLNFTLSAGKLAPGLELQWRIVNLLDRKIAHPASDEAPTATLPMDGRQWQLGLSYAF